MWSGRRRTPRWFYSVYSCSVIEPPNFLFLFFRVCVCAVWLISRLVIANIRSWCHSECVRRWNKWYSVLFYCWNVRVSSSPTQFLFSICFHFLFHSIWTHISDLTLVTESESALKTINGNSSYSSMERNTRTKNWNVRALCIGKHSIGVACIRYLYTYIYI